MGHHDSARARRTQGQAVGVLLAVMLQTAFAQEQAPVAESAATEAAPEAPAAPAPDAPMDLDTLAGAFGWNFENTVVRAEKLSDGLFLLFGVGGNVAVSIGEQGVLLVDDQFPQMMPKLKKAIENLGGKGVDFVINTHWHFDHADGNLTLGPEGAWIIAHSESQIRMGKEHLINLVIAKYRQPAYPPAARPVISYDDHMQLHFNGQDIDLLHFGPAHTTGDTAVFFRQANVVHLGDVFNAGYPFIDVDNGGDLDGVIHFCEAVLARVNEQTKVVPGHGPVLNRQGLIDYITMLRTVRSRIAGHLAEGASLGAVMEAKVTEEFDARYGDPTMLINRAYTSLSRAVQHATERALADKAAANAP